jgi:hypothetical protein
MLYKQLVAALLVWSIQIWGVGELALSQPSTSPPEQTLPTDQGTTTPARPATSTPVQTSGSQAEAAVKAINSLKAKGFLDRIKNPDEYARQLGFQSAAEVADAVLGTQPLVVKRVGLTQLSRFVRGSNIDELWDDVHAYLFPIYFKEEKEGFLRSSITVTEINKQWQWTRRGSPKLISQLEKYRAQFKQSAGSSDSLLVTIPGLNLHFLGQGTGSQLVLVPLADVKIGAVTLTAGQSLPASLVFEKLASEAVRTLEAERPPKGSQGEGNILLR